MNVTFTLTRWDVIRSNWLRYWPRSGRNVFVAALIYFFYQTINHVKALTLAYLASSFAASVLGALGIALLMFVVGAVFTMFRSSVRGGTLGEHRYELNEHGLRETTAAVNALHLWQGIKDIQKFKTYITIQASPLAFHVIPLRAFASAEAFDDFHKSALQHQKRAQQGAPGDVTRPAGSGRA